MKKVLILSLNYYPRFIGGAEVAIKEITDRISPEDIEFHMVTLRFDASLPEVEQIGNVLVHRIGLTRQNPSIADLRRYPLHLNKYLFQFMAAGKAHALHKQHRYDAIWGMMAHASAIPAGLFKKQHPDVRYLLTLQEGDPPEHIERLMRPVFGLFKQGFRSADAMQTISTFLLAWGRRMGFEGHGEVVPNGVDSKRFSTVHAPEDIARMQQSLGKKEGDVYIVTTSRLVHKNGLDDVIRALPLLPDTVSFLIYGIGPEEEALKRLATAQGVMHRVRFMGTITHEDMPRMLAACDIFARPSRSEGMGNSFVEAMAASIPVIATQEGGLSDFIFDKERNPHKPATAWAVDKDAPEQIATAVKAILADPSATHKTVATAKALALSEYDWNLVATKMKAIFSRLFKGGNI